MTRRPAAFALSTALLAACGGGTVEKSAADAPPSSTVAVSGNTDAHASRTGTTADACLMISPADLAEVFAPRTFVVDTSGPVSRNQPGTAKTNTITSCTYTSGTTMRDMMTINLTVVTAPNDAAHATVEQMKQGVAALGLNATPVDIASLGDAAYWVNLGSAQRSAIAVNVKHAPRQWLTIGESSAGDRVEESVDRLTKIARKALEQL